MVQDVRLKRLSNAQDETQKDPRENKSCCENLALKSLDNQRNSTREQPLIHQVRAQGEDRQQRCQHNQNGRQAGAKFSNSRKMRANALIKFRSQCQTKYGSLSACRRGRPGNSLDS